MNLENLKEIVNSARTVIWEDVKFFCDSPNQENLTDSNLLNDQKFYYERKMTAFDFCEYALNILKNQVDIQDIPMCVKHKGRTIWLPVAEDSTNKLFMAAAREKNPIISRIQFIIPQGLERKNALNKLLKTSGTEMVP